MAAATLNPSKQLATRPGTEILPDVEIFSASENAYPLRFADGSVKHYHFRAAELDRIVSNFHELYHGAPNGTRLKPIATVRHQRDKGITIEDPRCHGVVAKDLRRVGDKLVASLVDVPAATRAAIRRGELRNLSPEILPEFTDRGRDFGPVLYRVAYLGNQQPRDKSLAELPFADDPDGPLDVVICFADPVPIPEAAVSAVVEPTPAAKATLPPDDLARLREEAKAELRQEVMAFADEYKAEIRRQLDDAKANAAATAQLERDRLDREKREKVKHFLDSPGLCFADDAGRVRIVPCQRLFFEEALLREDAGAVLTFADGDRQVTGTALDRKMAEIRKFPPQLDFSEKMPQPGTDHPAETPLPDAERVRVLSLTPIGRGIIEREKTARLALPAAR